MEGIEYKPKRTCWIFGENAVGRSFVDKRSEKEIVRLTFKRRRGLE